MLVSVLGVSHVWGLSVSVGAWCVPCVGSIESVGETDVCAP